MKRYTPLLWIILTAAWASSPIHLVVDVTGGVTLKRAAWQAEDTLTFGTEVALGDLLRLTDTRAAVTIVCADLQVITISGRLNAYHAVACPEATPILTYRSLPIVPLRSQIAPTLPRILSPRATYLLSNRPEFRWQSVTDASYLVRLKQLPNHTLWEITTTENHIPYPDAAPLTAGFSYLLEVDAVADDQVYSSRAEGPTDISFRLLDIAQAQEVIALQDAITQSPLSPEAQALVLAHMYATYALYSDAITLLTPLMQAAPLLRLGTLYESIGLITYAELCYQHGLEIALHAGSLEHQAHASASLGNLFKRHYNNSSQAAHFYRLAAQHYGSLGDLIALDKLQQLLADIGKQP